MAASIAKYLLMRYFFPDIDRKKQERASHEFLVDMKFDLTKGSITKATSKLGNRKFLVSRPPLNCNVTNRMRYLSYLRRKMISFCIRTKINGLL